MATTDYPPPRTGTRVPGRSLSIVGFVLAGIAILFVPPLFALAAIALGIIAHSKGDPLGKWVIVAGIAGGVVGMALGAALLAANDESAMALLRR